MISELIWVSKNDECIYDLAFKPDGTQLIVGCGRCILVYTTDNSVPMQPLKGHKDVVYSVCYSKDGKQFASGSADNLVIIWSSDLKAILKYSHHDSVQCLAYNPVSHHLLASCTSSDFAFSSAESKSVSKHLVSSRITCCSWSNDGNYLAIGLYDGYVSIRTQDGEEKASIERPGKALSHVWSICWSPSKHGTASVLAIVDWGQTLSFYNGSGEQVAKDKTLDFDPMCVNYFPNGDYLLLGGSNKESLLYTKEGVPIGIVAKGNSWVWCCKSSPDSQHAAVGHHDGTVSYHKIVFMPVHSLYRERYACRKDMTTVVVRHLITGEEVRIKFRDLVKKISVFKYNLAVQLPERIIIYDVSLTSEDGKAIRYRVKGKINHKFECFRLLVCARNVLVVKRAEIQSLSFQGVVERDWYFESTINYIKIIGGLAGREGILLGLDNGQVLELFLDNSFPLPILKAQSAIWCLDLNCTGQLLAVVNSSGTCTIFDVNTKALLSKECDVLIVAWNTQSEDMLCLSGEGYMTIKAGNHETHSQNLKGLVVGFIGSKIFYYSFNNCLESIDVPQSTAMRQYIQRNMFSEAYKAACFGATESDWKTLGRAAMEGMDFDVARQAFVRLKEYVYLNLITSFEKMKKKEESYLILAEIYAYQGNFTKASQLYKESGRKAKAINMYTDLKKFDLAQEFLSPHDIQDRRMLLRKKADWVLSINNPREAANIYLTAGETTKAIEIAGQHGWVDMLMNVARRLSKLDNAAMTTIVDILRKEKQYIYAAELYRKMNDVDSLVQLFVESRQWEDALVLAEQHSEFKEDIYVPYSNWLIDKDRFFEAQKALHQAGKKNEALKLLEELTINAVKQKRFGDAGYYYEKLSMQCLDIAREDITRNGTVLEKFWEHRRKAEIYYAYHSVHRSTEEPFISQSNEAIFNMARYLLHETSEDNLPCISMTVILLALAKRGAMLGAYKLARYAYNKMQSLCLPEKDQLNIELQTLKIRSKPFNDSDNLLPLCYRCSTTNPLLNHQGNYCVNCKQPFVYSFVAFDILPLVEFVLQDGISDEEAAVLLDMEPQTSSIREYFQGDKDGSFQSLQLVHGASRHSQGDPFNRFIISIEEEGADFTPVVVDRSTLQGIDHFHVIVCKWPPPLRCRYFRNMLPETQITKCSSCRNVFHTDDFQKQVLKYGYCPFCRSDPQDSETYD